MRVILDIDNVDWDFKIQAGAFKRVIMNLFGNSMKYTVSGFILVSLSIKKDEEVDSQLSSPKASRQTVSLRILDSGKGMVPEFMERKLYQPFAQENSLATGVGLGLSIV